MAVISNNLLFLHVPKTGGTWVTEMLSKIFSDTLIIRGERSIGHEAIEQLRYFRDNNFSKVNIVSSVMNKESIISPDDERMNTLLSLDFDTDLNAFFFVREPLSFYRSFWHYRMWKGWSPRHAVDSRCQSDNFEEFIENVVRYIPGWCSDLFHGFIPQSPHTKIFIGRYERLVDDFFMILTKTGNSLLKEVLESSPPVNASPKKETASEISLPLLKKFFESEFRAYETFGYPRPF